MTEQVHPSIPKKAYYCGVKNNCNSILEKLKIIGFDFFRVSFKLREKKSYRCFFDYNYKTNIFF